MELNSLPIGLKLQIHLSDTIAKENGNRAMPMVSMLEEFDGGDYIYIGAPLFENRIYPIQIGTELSIYYNYNKNLYRFKGRVIERKIDGNISSIKILKIANIEKIQRREFFRCDMIIPAKYRKISGSNEDINIRTSYKMAYTKNIGGGGICITIGERLEVFKLVELEFTLKNAKRFNLNGTVIWINESSLSSDTRFDTGIWFENITNNAREEIINFVFKEQRRQIQKGII